jgi:hypothetical protein
MIYITYVKTVYATFLEHLTTFNSMNFNLTQYSCLLGVRVGVVVFNITLNNISVISWRSVLLEEETRVLRENHRPAASH